MITRSGYSVIKRGSVGGWKSYYFTEATEQIMALRSNKRLRFDNVSVLSLSLDTGATYPITLDLTGVCDIITRSKIYPNGNIMWANQTKCFYSQDNLATYHESTMIDINGDPWVATGQVDNFKQVTWDCEDIIVDGICMDVWGNYSTIITEMNVWYTIDSGVTIKSAFKNNQTIPGQNFRHNHGITYNADLDEFIHEYGDPVSGWNRGVYDWDMDSWSWESIVTEDGSGYHKTAGMQFHDGYAYFTSDSTDAAKHGIWKCPYEDIGTGNNYTQVTDLYSIANGLSGINGVMITANTSSTAVEISVDYGLTWEHHILEGGPAAVQFLCYHATIGPDDNNFYRADIQEDPDDEAQDLTTKGVVLMMQIIPTLGSE